MNRRAAACFALSFACAIPSPRMPASPQPGDALPPATPPPSIGAVTPDSGEAGAGVVITGTGFDLSARVYFGLAAADAAVESAVRIRATAPPHPAGEVEVSVVNPGGARASLAAAFSYPGGPVRPRPRTCSEPRPQRPAGCPAQPVRFEYTAANANQVLLAGEFTGWRAGALAMQQVEGKWIAEVPLAEGDHEYKFIVDGVWTSDPAAPAEPLFGNSVKAVDDPCTPRVKVLVPDYGEIIDGGEVALEASYEPGRTGADAHGPPRSLQLCVGGRSHAVSFDAARSRISARLKLADGRHLYTLSITDGAGFSAPAASGFFDVDAQDEAPVADAGPMQVARAGQRVILDGAGSHDPDFRGLTTFTWTQESGPSTVLQEFYVSDRAGYEPNAPPVPTTPARQSFTPARPGVYRFALSVADARAPSPLPSRVEVVVLPAERTVARARIDLSDPAKVALREAGAGHSYCFREDLQAPASLGVNACGAARAAAALPSALPDGAYRVFAWLEKDGAASDPAAVLVSVKNGARRVSDYFLAPEWTRDTTLYEIFVRRFDDDPAAPDGTGDLRGLKARLPYLQDLGVQTLWLMPVFHSNDRAHGYHTVDYYRVEPDYGTREDLRALLDDAHARGLKIVLDLAINHTSRRHPLFERARQPASRFRDWYVRFCEADSVACYGYGRELGGTRLRVEDGWADIPDINYGNPEARRYFFDVAKDWVRAGVDGLRLDHVTGPEHVVWQALRRDLKAINPDVLLLAEVFRDFDNGGQGYGIKDYYRGEFDAAFTFPFHWDALGVFKDGDAPGRVRATTDAMASDRFPEGALHALFLENHDVPSGSTAHEVLGGDAQVAAATTLQLLLPSAPQLLYGQELGNDEFRGAMPWERAETSTLRRRVKALLTARADRTELRRGDLVWLPNDQEWAVLSFARRAGSARTIGVVNARGQAVSAVVDLSGLGASTGLDDLLDDGAGVSLDVAQKRATLNLAPYAARVFALE